MRDRAGCGPAGDNRTLARERYGACSEFFSLAGFEANLVDTR